MRKAFIIRLAGLAGAIILIAWSAVLSAEAVFVLSSDDPQYQKVAEAFKSSYEGEVELINLYGSDERLNYMGQRLKESPPAFAVVVGDHAVRMAKLYLEGVPVVYCEAPNAARIGLEADNVYGIYHEPDPAEQIRMLHEVFPQAQKVVAVFNPEHARVSPADIEAASGKQGIALINIAVMNFKEAPQKIREALEQGEIVWVFEDPVVISTHSIKYLVMESLKAKIPLFCGSSSLGRGGAAAAWIPDLKDTGETAAYLASKIQAGSPPTTGVLRYPKGQLIINRKITNLLNVTVSEAAVSNAAELIE